jgi:hypothetical protein
VEQDQGEDMKKFTYFISSASFLVIATTFVVMMMPIKARAATCEAICRTGTLTCSGTTCYASDYWGCASTGSGNNSKTCDQFDFENLV